MIRKLKRRFIALAMTSLVLLMTVIVAGMNIINYNSVVKEADETLEMLSDNHGRMPVFFGDMFDQFFGGPGGEGGYDDIDARTEDGNSGLLPWVGRGGRRGGMSRDEAEEMRYFSVLLDPDNNVVWVNTERIYAVDEEAAGSRAASAAQSGRISGFDGDYRYRVSYEGTYTRVTFLDCGRMLDAFSSFLLASLGVSLAGLAVIFAVICYFAGRIVRPVAESYEKQKRFITDAGHEIRTPLTIIKANIDIMKMDIEDELEADEFEADEPEIDEPETWGGAVTAIGPETKTAGAAVCPETETAGAAVCPETETACTAVGPEIETAGAAVGPEAETAGAAISRIKRLAAGLNESLDDIAGQVDRLTALTNDLVYLSRMEEAGSLTMTEVPLSDIVSETADTFRAVAAERNKELSIDTAPMISIKGSTKELEKLVSILVDNALKYSPEGDRISVSLKRDGRTAVLEVKNRTNEPVTDDDLAHVFERFYRSDKSRNSAKDGGHGIGLSMASAIVAAHGGKIRARSGDGMEFIVTASMPAV